MTLPDLDTAVIDLEVGPIAHGGHCVARAADGRVVFVRHALPGERVRAVVTEQRKGFLRADAVEVLTPSPDRVTPPCPWAGPDRCGGCDFQHASLAAQRELKAAVVREQLLRLGGFSQSEVDVLDLTVVALPGSEDGLGWRTRVQYTVDASGRAGLLKHRSHEVVPVDYCRIAHPAVRAAPVLDKTWDDLDGLEVVSGARSDGRSATSRAGSDGRSASSRAGSDGRSASSRAGSDGRSASSRAGGDVTVLGTRGRGRPMLVSGPSRTVHRALGRDWGVPADTFWQVHPAAADTLAATVVELLAPRPGERAWDLYGGAGLFAAALAPLLTSTGAHAANAEGSASAGRITVVESDPKAAGAAQRLLRDLTTITVVKSNVEHALANPRWRSVDLVVLDPPRSGAGPLVVERIADRSPRAVAYVACDPAALARDLTTFRQHGYHLDVLRAFDLFPMTHHVECVALLLRQM